MKDQVYAILEKHYRENYDTIVRRCNRYLQNMHNAEDIVQEAYCRAFKYWEAFPDDGEVDKWMNSIIANCSRDFHKQEIMRGMADACEGDEITINSSGVPAVVYSEILERIWSKEPPIANMLYFAFVQQWRPSDIVMAGMGDTPGQVRQLVHRFRKEIVEDFKVET